VAGWNVWAARIVLLAFGLAGLIVIFLLQRTGRQRRRLAEEHSRLRILAQVVESAGEAISGRDLDGRFMSWNPAAERLFGWTAAEVIGHGLEHPMHGAQRDVVQAMIRAVTTTRTVQESETSRISDTGQSVLIVVTMAPLFDEHGDIVGVSSSGRDITERRRLEDQLRQSESMFRSAFDGALLGMCLTGLDGRLVRVNEVFATMMGRTTTELTGMHANQLTHPDHRDAHDTRLQQTANGEIDGFRKEDCYLDADGSEVWADSATSVIHNSAGEPEHFVTQLVDVTLRRAALRERDARDAMLAAVNARFSALVEHSSDAITITGKEGRLVYVSPAFATLTGSETAGRVGQDMEELIHPDDRAGVERSLGTLMADGDVTTYECRIRHATAGWRHIEVTASNWLGDPAVSGIVANARDVTERVEVAADLAHQAMHDLLTDLPNRALLLDRLEQALARADRSQRPSALLFVDLDRFKQINDSLGHAAGDHVLTAVAERLSEVVRSGDTVARLGGDEFVVLAEDITDPSVVEEIAERIRTTVASPIIVAEQAVSIGCSIGIAISDRHNPETLLQEADMALYQAKGAGRNRWELYDQTMRTLAQRRLEIEQLVRNAITGDQLEVHYQPVVDLRTDLITATEALVRIRAEDGQLVGPDEFIGIAEDCGLIIALGTAVLRQACERQARWREKGAGLHHVAVNVSARQLVSGFATCVAAVLAETGLPAEMLCLELTETALIDAGNASRQEIADIKALGVTLALDDFGTGWSSLAYLRRFPFDIVKIDRSFVTGLGTDKDDTAVVKAVIGLGQALGLRVVAEGVETELQHRALRQLGCDHGQGYLYGRPKPADQVSTGAVSIVTESIRPRTRRGARQKAGQLSTPAHPLELQD
jgi:diguanylate cyclase (GGDEF)-like protein/PAS domain S-box-containing protein